MRNINDINSIPLLLHFVSPVAVCVINNIKIGCEPFEDIQQAPYKAYNFIRHLYVNSKPSKDLPYNFVDFFKNRVEMALDGTCFGGLDEIYGNINCIDFTIQLEGLGKKPIIIKDIIYGKRQLDDIVTLNLQVKLSIYESFIIFSNICANNLIYWWWDLYKCNIDDILDNKTKISEITKKSIMVQSQYNLHLFSMGYLYYLRNALKNSIISPLELLRLNGAPVLSLFTKLPIVNEFVEEMFNDLLNLKSLSENRKILYYTFIKHFQFMPHKAHNEFLKKTPQILSELENMVYSKFPDTYQIGEILERANSKSDVVVS